MNRIRLWGDNRYISKSNTNRDKRIMNQHPEEQKESRSLLQAIEQVLRKNGLEPKWDYSKAGQSVIMPTRKKDRGK